MVPAEAAGRPEDSQRESRRLLSAAACVPAFLLERWPLPDGYSMSHTTWKDKVLPHFQGRLGPGEKMDNKPLDLICPDSKVMSI